MPFTSGTATDPKDLLQKLQAFVTDDVSGAGWPLSHGGDGLDAWYGCKNLRTNDTASDIYAIVTGDADSYINAEKEHYYDFEFYQDTEIESFAISMPDLNAGSSVLTISSSPIRIALQYSSDGVSWTNWFDESNIPIWSDIERRVFTPSAPVSAKWFRLTFPQERNNSFTTIGELQFYGAGGSLLWAARGRYNHGFDVVSPYVASGVSALARFTLSLSDQEGYYSLGLIAGTGDYKYIDETSGYESWGFLNASTRVYAYLWDAPMPYWFYGDDRYIYGFVKVGSTYRQFGCGYLLSYSTPSQWPFPVFVGAENNSRGEAWDNDSTANIRGFTAPGRYGLYMFHPASNSWVEYSNYYMSISETRQQLGYKVWPNSMNDVADLGINADSSSYALYPLTLFHVDTQVFGEMQNLYFVPGGTISSEDTITVGADTYRIFQNMWRTARSDYIAVKEV
jgi:hypothetical protein